MKLILAFAPTGADHGWSAWSVTAPPAAGAGLSLEAAQRLDDSPSSWPTALAVVLVVPAARLSWHQVTLPRLPRPRWPQALMGLLEDQLLSEPSQLHMAVSPDAQAGSTTWVTVCDKAWLQQILAQLQASGHPVQRVVPEFEPGAPALHLTGQPEQAQLVHVDEQGVLVMPLGKPVREALQAWAPTLPDAHAASLRTEPALADAAQTGLHRPVELMHLAQRLWQAAQSDWNLAQFDLAASQGPQRLRRVWAQAWQAPTWRPLRWGLLALIVVQVLGLMGWAWQESARQRAQAQELQAILRSSFPQVKLIIDPLQQMRREVQALAQASGSPNTGDLGVMLSALAEAGAPPIKSLNYSSGQLQLDGWDLPAAQAAPLQAALALRGYRLQGQGQQWQLKGSAP